jgi:tripartite-type tricarboxylate transporter receptor subunit TctC
MIELLAALLLCVPAQAQESYPSKPVRMLAAKLSDAFGRPFIVEDVPGAGGVVAAEQVARAPADGHVLMLGSPSALAINIALNPKVTYHPLRDFTPITALAAVPSVLIAHPGVPAASLQEFVALARAKPGDLSYGSAGAGSIHHLTMSAFLARAGKLRVYAISTAQRSAMLPDVATVAELGYPGFDIATVIGLQALRERDVVERMANLGMDLMESGTEHYARFLKEDLERYAMAVKAAGMKHE